jgi:plastocyanin
MKRIALLAASLLLVGQGCKVGQQAEFKAQTPPAAQPAQPATPPTEPGQKAQPAQPAEPPSDAIKAEIEANAGVDVMVKLEAKVTITAGGTFSPATLTVKKGTKVTWTNAGSLPVWPASAPHPVHTDYPGFDAKTDLRNGESWSFTFDKTGSWNYHNHLNPSVTGTVIVTE